MCTNNIMSSKFLIGFKLITCSNLLIQSIDIQSRKWIWNGPTTSLELRNWLLLFHTNQLKFDFSFLFEMITTNLIEFKFGQNPAKIKTWTNLFINALDCEWSPVKVAGCNRPKWNTFFSSAVYCLVLLFGMTGNSA